MLDKCGNACYNKINKGENENHDSVGHTSSAAPPAFVKKEREVTKMTFTSTIAFVIYIFVAVLLAVIGFLFNEEKRKHFPNIYQIAALFLVLFLPLVKNFLENL